MADFSSLNAEMSKLTDQVTASETVEASAVALINNQAALTKAAVAQALADNDAADQTSIDAANQAIDAVASRLTASAGTLGTAITANTPAAPGGDGGTPASPSARAR